jgi:hypothetical protein
VRIDDRADHCGGNPVLGTTPALAQRTEVATVSEPVVFAHDDEEWRP